MILDTNALSAVAEEHKAAVAELAKAQFIAIPVIVLGESGLESRSPDDIWNTNAG